MPLRLLLSLGLLAAAITGFAQKSVVKSNNEYIAIRVYHATDNSQLPAIKEYLQASLHPALEKAGFDRTGYFEAVDNDTATDKRLFVVLPLRSLPALETLELTIEKTLGDSMKSPAYTKATYNAPTVGRIETILLRAFSGMPRLQPSGLKAESSDRVYELRSYESATEALHLNKVQMFNAGEVELFDRLGFNAVFYGQVLAGSRMPNLMYMTSFANKASRDEHWKTFGADPEWKSMSSNPEYQHNVSKINISFLRPLAFSKL